MALFTDGLVSTMADLQAYDSAILETAKTEGVQLSTKLAVADDAVGLEVAAFLLRTQAESVLPSSSAAYDLSRVVVTPALRRWHTLRALTEVYCDVHNSQLNDRYLGKWKHFSKLAREAADLLFELGVGIVDRPVPRAPKPVVVAAGDGGPVGAYLVQIAWRSNTGASGAPSEAAAFPAPAGELFQVEAGPAPGNVTGFDVYASVDGGASTLQTSSPIAVGQAWSLPSSGLVAGLAATSGQGPEYFVRRNRLL